MTQIVFSKDYNINKLLKVTCQGDFPGGPVVKTPCFQFRGRGFDPWWGN